MDKDKEILSKRFIQAVDTLIDKGKFKNSAQCAIALNLSSSQLSEIRYGKKSVQPDVLNRIMELGFTANYLYGKEDEEGIPLNINFVPMDIHAGNSKANLDEMVKDNQLEKFRFPSFMKLEGELFAFNVKGNSMENTILDGDLVICRKIDSPFDIVDGKVYVLLFKSEYVVKRLYKKIFDKRIVGIDLISDNEDYPKRCIEERFFEGLRGNLFKVLKRMSTENII